MMKKIFLRLLLLQMSCCFTAYGAATADSHEKINPKDVTLLIRQSHDSLDAEKAAFISGMSVTDKNNEHAGIFSLASVCFKTGFLSCASILVKGAVVGVMFYSQNEQDCNNYLLDYIAIGEEHQHKGIGGCAIDLLAKMIKAKQIQLKALKGTEPFYEKMGFKRNGTDWFTKIY